MKVKDCLETLQRLNLTVDSDYFRVKREPCSNATFFVNGFRPKNDDYLDEEVQAINIRYSLMYGVVITFETTGV